MFRRSRERSRAFLAFRILRGSATAHDSRNEAGEATRDLFADSGRVRTAQKDGTVLALYQSKAQFLDDYSVLRVVIVIPVFYRGLGRITIGDRAGNDPDIVWIEDDYIYAAFRPLILTDHGRNAAVSVDRNNGYVSISFYNYEGAPRRFTRRELLYTLNGFVAEIGSPANTDRLKTSARGYGKGARRTSSQTSRGSRRTRDPVCGSTCVTASIRTFAVQ